MSEWGGGLLLVGLYRLTIEMVLIAAAWIPVTKNVEGFCRYSQSL